jgi:hypothetical protein
VGVFSRKRKISKEIGEKAKDGRWHSLQSRFTLTFQESMKHEFLH